MNRIINNDNSCRREKRVPPGQYSTRKFPVMTAGRVPKIVQDDWKLQIFGLVEEEVGQPRSDGKVSAVQFVHFAFSDEQTVAFRNNRGPITLQIDHPFYKYVAILDVATRTELAMDFDSLQ